MLIIQGLQHWWLQLLSWRWSVCVFGSVWGWWGWLWWRWGWGGGIVRFVVLVSCPSFRADVMMEAPLGEHCQHLLSAHSTFPSAVRKLWKCWASMKKPLAAKKHKISLVRCIDAYTNKQIFSVCVSICKEYYICIFLSLHSAADGSKWWNVVSPSWCLQHSSQPTDTLV